jgi:hypothetical protein
MTAATPVAGPRQPALTTSWEDANNAYLAAGLAWLRARLTGQPTEAWWESPRWRELAVPPAAEILGDALGMSRFERLVLLLVAATELDPQIGAELATATGQFADHASFALALTVLPDPTWDVLSPQRPLRYWRLVEIHQPPGDSLVGSRLRADERIVGFLKGLSVLDDRLSHLLTPLADVLDEPLPPSQQPARAQIAAAWTQSIPTDRPPVVEIVGVDPLTRRGLAASAARLAAHDVYEIAADHIPAGALDAAELLRLCDREALLHPIALYVDVADARPDDARPITALLEAARGPVLVGCREPWPIPGRRIRIVDAHRPTPAEQEALWCDQLGPANADDAARLAGEFDLNQVAVRDLAREAAHATTVAGGRSAALWSVCRAQARPRLDVLAKRIEPVASWDDLVLPPEELKLLHHMVDQVRGRATVLRSWGFGERITRGSAITALFAGQSGTGKTLAAEVVAHALNFDLYRIDLSGVVSKYIGETERNLRRVFDAADEGGALLLFDEADALFGKRSEVKDSHDRYANIEVSYLLQRMEDYRGVAILATNQRNALDQAFLRRLRFVLTFPFPAHAERAALWARAFPARAPVEEIDCDRLAALAATGGMIRNIALNAAFCAAGRNGPVTMDLVLEMARVEFRKQELPVSEADFR